MSRHPLGARELQKKEREIAPCRVVAKTINARRETDYYAPDAEYQLLHCRASVDVVLLSRAGLYPQRNIQVVTAPFAPELRDDTNNVSALERNLRKALLAQHYVGMELQIFLTESGVLKPTPRSVVRCLVEVVCRMPRQGSWSIDSREIWRLSPDLGVYVSDVSGTCLPSESLFVNAGRGNFLPDDERFIEQAIRHKEDSKYSPTDVSALTLVIEAASSIDPQQIDAFLSSGKCATILFDEAWIVSPYSEYAVLLKSSF